MDRKMEAYRQQIIGQLQIWEGKLAHLRADAQAYEGTARQHFETRLRELEVCHRMVFGRYADLLLADANLVDEKRLLLDAATRRMEEMLLDFALEPVS